MAKNDEKSATDAVAESQQRIAKLREQVAAEEAKRDTILREAHDEIMAAKLRAQEEALSESLGSAKESSKAAKDTVRAALKEAEAGTEEQEPQADGAATLPTGETVNSKDKE